jgi:hypothetical protein
LGETMTSQFYGDDQRETNHRNEPCGKTGAARGNDDVRDYQGGSQLKTLRNAALSRWP